MNNQRIISISKSVPEPIDYMGECQIACQAAAVVAAHFTRPSGDKLARIIAQIGEQVLNEYKAKGISFSAASEEGK